MRATVLAAFTFWSLVPACDEGGGQAASSPDPAPVEAPENGGDGEAAKAEPPVPEVPISAEAGPGQDAKPPTEIAAGPTRAEGVGKGVDVVALHQHELLGSERRALEKLVQRFTKAGVAARLIENPAPARAQAIAAWIDTVGADARSALDTDVAIGEAAGVVAIRLRPEQRRVSQDQDALVVLQRGPNPELLWVAVENTGVMILGDTADATLALVDMIEGAQR
jgi:hypothetical protein